MSQSEISRLVKISEHLASMDPQDEAVQRTVQVLQSEADLLRSKASDDQPGFSKDSMKDDIAFIGQQISRLKSAAMVPAANWRRIMSILDGLDRAAVAAARPSNAALRPKIATIFQKVAGIFKEVDTVEDLDKPLEAIEKAVHSLYGDQSSNKTYYFDRRGKGHHSESK
jgi:hypothetical protein